MQIEDFLVIVACAFGIAIVICFILYIIEFFHDWFKRFRK